MTLATRISLALLFVFTAGGVLAEPMREVVIKVDGMFCPFCTFGIEKRLNLLPETAAVRTDLAAGEAIVTLKPEAEFVAKHFAAAIKRAGFTHSGITLREVAASTKEATKGDSTPAIPPLPQRDIAPAPSEIGFTFKKVIGEAGITPGQFD